MIFINDSDFTLYVGDALETLRTLPDGSVDCCVTSPPYWGLRDYGTGEWEGGGEGWSDCGHGDYRPGIVLDPFMGSGTVAYVARANRRHCIGIELNEEYAALIAKRTSQLSLLA